MNLYIYYLKEYEQNIKLEYIDENLNNPNNEYTFNVISHNNENDKEKKTLIIKNKKMNEISYQINFCNPINHYVKMYYQGVYDLEENILVFNNENRIYNKQLDKIGTKIRFESKEDFIFSYSYIDSTDEQLLKNDNWIKERKVLNNLNIYKVINKKNDIILIKFYPNYKKSSTRYFIIIAPKTEYNSEENFANPCYITNFIIEPNKNVKIKTIFDIGENGIINAEVNISDIKEGNKYIVNIITVNDGIMYR